MAILCTMPGRAGDILWALPTIRALSEARGGEPIDLQVCGEFRDLVPILHAPYLGHVWTKTDWHLVPPAEWDAPITPTDRARYGTILHLGYRGWPDQPLAQTIYHQVQHLYPDQTLAALDLDRPWIDQRLSTARLPFTYGFNENYVELKYGLMQLLWRRQTTQPIWPPLGLSPQWVGMGERWQIEGGFPSHDWSAAREHISRARVHLGCCSGLHVLAVAMGVPVLVYEPIEARWNPIFYPLGKGTRPGDQVYLITGHDGLPTTDARHTAEALTAAMERCQ